MLFLDFDTDSVLNLKTVENLENLIFAVFLVKNKQKKPFIFICACLMQSHRLKHKRIPPQIFHNIFVLVLVQNKDYVLCTSCRNLAFHRFLTKDSLSQSSQLHVGVLKSFFHLLIHRLLLALDHNGRATV